MISLFLKPDHKRIFFKSVKLITILIIFIFSTESTLMAQNNTSDTNSYSKPVSSVITSATLTDKDSLIIMNNPVIPNSPGADLKTKEVTETNEKLNISNQKQTNNANLTEIEKYESTDPSINKKK